MSSEKTNSKSSPFFFLIFYFIYRMSTQRGNTARSRPQKHQNKSKFKNNLHDTSHKTKLINNIHVSDVCERCKEVIEWKIKYKKYKPLTQPKKCVKCEQKTVKKAYHVMCTECGKNLEVCTKCCQVKEVVPNVPDKHEEIKLDYELQQMLQSLPERKRRTFIRYMNKTKNSEEKPEERQKDLASKLNKLNVDDKDSDIDFDEFDSDICDEDSES